VRGFDSGLFADCTLSEVEAPRDQIWRDIRAIEAVDVEGLDGVIHLAGLSNDPLGELDPSLTQAINFDATVRLGELARNAGVRRFVYASSQSMYGISDSDQALDEDLSEKLPLTAYAKTKWEAELALMSMRAPGFEVTAFRPSTVFGASPRLRCDIVFNNFMACAFTTGSIEIKSDGKPRRPAVHVLDVCEAFIAGLEADASLVDGRAFNVGVADGNYTVRQLALAAQAAVPGTDLVFTGEHGSDSRTYTVGFDRILGELGSHFNPSWDLDRGGAELVRFFRETGFEERHFRGGVCNRLIRIGELIEAGRIDESLRTVES
jgi:nucleoside-diphosphate-sugar epimerase